MVPLKRLALLAAMAIAALALAAPGPAVPAKAEKRAKCAKPKARAGEWPFYGGTHDNHREQLKERSIDSGNVSELGVAWQTTTPDGSLIRTSYNEANLLDKVDANLHGEVHKGQPV